MPRGSHRERSHGWVCGRAPLTDPRTRHKRSFLQKHNKTTREHQCSALSWFSFTNPPFTNPQNIPTELEDWGAKPKLNNGSCLWPKTCGTSTKTTQLRCLAKKNLPDLRKTGDFGKSRSTRVLLPLCFLKPEAKTSCVTLRITGLLTK